MGSILPKPVEREIEAMTIEQKRELVDVDVGRFQPNIVESIQPIQVKG